MPRFDNSDGTPLLKDWRYAVSGFGRVLVAIGLLMLGFVAYQLWGTGIQTSRAQNGLQSQFEQAIADAAPTPNTMTSAPAADPTTTALSTGVTARTTAPRAAAATPTVATTTAAISTIPNGQPSLPPIERGGVLAKLEIPRMGKVGGGAMYVVPGVGVSDLKKGPGHYPDTPLPGQLGNSAIAGHRTTYGAPFRRIDELEPGDAIRITMLTGDVFVYEVTGTKIVEPSDYHVVSDSDPTIATLTLTSCHPEFSARQRIVVRAILRPERSSPVGRATFYDLEADADGGLPRDDTGNVLVDDPTVTQPEDRAGRSTGGLASTPSIVSSSDTDFAGGWFDDPAAWPHIVGWGLSLAAIAWMVRRSRFGLTGLGAGLVPFVVCLYFFYENVSRVLPADL
jgi:sortase A